MATVLDVAARGRGLDRHRGPGARRLRLGEPATLQRVLAAAAQIGYRAEQPGAQHDHRPDPHDRRRPGRHREPLLHGVLRGITDTAREHGFDVLLANTDEDADNERQAVTALFERRVEGLILCPVEGDDRLASCARSSSWPSPSSLLDRPAPGLKVDTVGLDNRRAGRRGDERTCSTSGTAASASSPAARTRCRSAAAAGHEGRRAHPAHDARDCGRRATVTRCSTPGITPRPELPDVRGLPPRRRDRVGARADGAAGPAHGDHRLRQHPGARRASSGSASLGLRCPEDVSLIGFDDAEWAEVVSPSLSVVRQPVHEIGVQACELLLRRIATGTAATPTTGCAATLVPRGSTAPPPSQG